MDKWISGAWRQRDIQLIGWNISNFGRSNSRKVEIDFAWPILSIASAAITAINGRNNCKRFWCVYAHWCRSEVRVFLTRYSCFSFWIYFTFIGWASARQYPSKGGNRIGKKLTQSYFTSIGMTHGDVIIRATNQSNANIYHANTIWAATTWILRSGTPSLVQFWMRWWFCCTDRVWLCTQVHTRICFTSSTVKISPIDNRRTTQHDHRHI